MQILSVSDGSKIEQKKASEEEIFSILQLRS
jgi:hypothetical protein